MNRETFISRDTKEIQNVVSEYFKILHSAKVENLKEIVNF